jgi:hypothetical protein
MSYYLVKLTHVGNPNAIHKINVRVSTKNFFKEGETIRIVDLRTVPPTYQQLTVKVTGHENKYNNYSCIQNSIFGKYAGRYAIITEIAKGSETLYHEDARLAGGKAAFTIEGEHNSVYMVILTDELIESLITIRQQKLEAFS